MSTAPRQAASPTQPPLRGRTAVPAARQSSYSPAYMAAMLAASDFGMLATAILGRLAFLSLINPTTPPLRPEMLLLPLCCVGVFAGTSQYPGIGFTAVEQNRKSVA